MFDIEAIRRKHRNFSVAHAHEVDARVNSESVTQLVQRYASQHGGFTSRSGNLVRKTVAKVVPTRRGNLMIRTSNSAKYAAAQDGGSGLYGPKRAKYVIRPKHKKALAFMAGGSLVFARSVLHPGVHPTRFLYNANDAAFRTVRGWLLVAQKRAASRF